MLLGRLHLRLERAALGQPVAIVMDGVLIGHRAAKIEAEKAHPAQPFADHEPSPELVEGSMRASDRLCCA